MNGADIVAAAAGATAVIGFISIWIKTGIEKGENKKTLETLDKRVSKNEDGLVELRSATHNIQLEIAKSIVKIEAKLDFIKETITKLESNGGHCAEKK